VIPQANGAFSIAQHEALTQESKLVDAVDAAAWLWSSFNFDDYLMLKMDIEGMEFGLLRRLAAGGKLCLVDHLLIQCHNAYGSCKALMRLCLCTVGYLRYKRRVLLRLPNFLSGRGQVY